MPDDVGKILAVSLEARITKMEREFNRAKKVSAQSFDQIERRSKTASQRLEQNMARAGRAASSLDRSLRNVGREAFLGVSRNAMIALAPVLSVAAAINGAKSALREFDDVGKQAKSAGLDAEFFQGLAYQAKLGGVEVGQLSAALNAFAKNAGLATAGRGELVEKLKLLDPVLLENIRNASTQEERIRLVADAIEKETNASKRAALAAAAFGDAGVKMVEVLRGGADSIDTTIAKARELGIIVDREVIARAEQVNDEFTTASEIVDIKLKQALINIAPLLVGAANWAAEFARLMGVAADQFQKIEDRKFINPLQNKLVEIENTRATIVMEMQGLKDQLAELDPASGMAGVIAGEIEQKAARAEELMLQALDYQERIAQLQGKPAGAPRATVAPVTEGGADLPAPVGALPAGASTRTRAAVDAINQAQAVRTLIADLQHEQSLIGQTETQQRVANALRQAGAAATDEQRAEIEALIVSMDKQRASIEGNEQAMKSLGNGIANAFSDFLTGAQSADEAVRQLIASLAQAAIRAAFMGDGPFGNAIGGSGLLGGLLGFAGGGYTGDGSRLEPAGIVHRGEYVVPASAVRRLGVANLEALSRGTSEPFSTVRGLALSSSAGTLTVAPTINVTVEGGSRGPAADAEMGRVVAAEVERTVRGIVADEFRVAQRPGNLANRRA